MFRKRLCVVGAGPKGIAIAVKAKVLRDVGFHAPQICLIERKEVASHWLKDSGLTNGIQPLGTSPEKDVGFPYASFNWGATANHKVNRKMQNFSWSSFLVDTNRYSDWIDRGKPAPNHQRWAEYLKWVWEKIQDETELVLGRLEAASEEGGEWKLEVGQKSGKRVMVSCQGLVLTGPGRPKMPVGLPADDRILSTDKFWRNCESLARSQGARFAVIGTGETAASIAVVLGASHSISAVDIISPLAMNYSRGESYVENHVYTDPFQANWAQLTIENRRDFINRTDRGVFSLVTKRQLDEMENLEIIPGRLMSVEIDSLNQLIATVQYAQSKERRSYDYLVFATGFDPWGWFEEILSPSLKETWKSSMGLKSLDEESLELQITESLALRGVTPLLHLPMLAAVAQGPGFPNLSCLGRVSDQILSHYVSLEE